MWWIDLLLALAIALVLSFALISLFGWRHPARTDDAAASAIFLFVVLTLLMWAGGVWAPIGPTLGGGAWMPLLVIGVFLALLLVALHPAPRRDRRSATPPEDATLAAAGAVALFGVFFWILAIAAVAAIIAGYAV